MVFEIIDKTERKIHLSDERWKHIKQDHPNIKEEEIKITIQNSLKVSARNPNLLRGG